MPTRPRSAMGWRGTKPTSPIGRSACSRGCASRRTSRSRASTASRVHGSQFTVRSWWAGSKYPKGVQIKGRRRRAVVFLVVGACLVALAVAFNIGWILLSWREEMLLALGLLLFPLIVAGLVLNTIFLVREVRRNEQHNAFINAVTHELKTLQGRAVEEPQRQEFYRTMLADTARLLASVEQILRAGRAGHTQRALA